MINLQNTYLLACFWHQVRCSTLSLYPFINVNACYHWYLVYLIEQNKIKQTTVIFDYFGDLGYLVIVPCVKSSKSSKKLMQNRLPTIFYKLLHNKLSAHSAVSGTCQNKMLMPQNTRTLHSLF